MQHITHEQTDNHVSNRCVPASTRLRRMLADQGSIISAPGVYDGISARLALAAGFKCMYVSVGGTSMSRLGMANLGLVTFTDMLANASMIASIDPATPVIANAEAGYGGPIMVHRVVQACARAGIAALSIEDHDTGESPAVQVPLVSPESWYAKLRAAVAARDEIGSDMVIIACTDANRGAGFDEAIARLRGAHECGVDALFLDAPKSVDECRRACDVFSRAGVPMVLNMTPGGATPEITAEEARALGFRVVVWPTAVLETVFTEGVKALTALKERGTIASPAIGPRKMAWLCGFPNSMAVDAKARSKAHESA